MISKLGKVKKAFPTFIVNITVMTNFLCVRGYKNDLILSQKSIQFRVLEAPQNVMIISKKFLWFGFFWTSFKKKLWKFGVMSRMIFSDWGNIIWGSWKLLEQYLYVCWWIIKNDFQETKRALFNIEVRLLYC